MRVAIYARQSVDHTEGAADQERRARGEIEARDWTLAGVYVDNDVSAVKERGEGTEWARLLADIRSGAVEAIAMTDVDRLVRDLEDALTLIKLDGLRYIVTIDSEYALKTASGERAFVNDATGSRFEVRRKHERAMRGNERRAAAGTYENGARPFGYRRDDRRQLHPIEAPLLQEAYARILDGETLYAVAADWNRREISTHSASLAREAMERDPERDSPERQAHHAAKAAKAAEGWTTPAVKALLLRERNVGRVVLRGEVQEGVTARWEPLVDAETFEAVRTRLTDPARRTALRGRKAKYLAGGIAVCAVCGRNMRSSINGAGVPAYRCRVDQDRGGVTFGHHGTAPVSMVDPNLSEAVYEALLDDPEAAPHDPRSDALADLRRDRLELVRRRQVIQEELLEADADQGHLRTLRRQIATRLEGIDAQIGEQEAEAAKDSARDIVRAAVEHLERVAAEERPWTAGEVVTSLAGGEAWRQWWESLDIERKRELIRATLDITIYPTHIAEVRPVRELRRTPGGDVDFVTVKEGRDGPPRVDIQPKRKATR